MKELEEAANEVHAALGTGFTENVYHRSLERELSERGIPFSSEGTIPIFYKGSPVGRRRPDLFVEGDDGTIVVELKAGSNAGDQQLLQYLDLLDKDNNYDITEGWLIQFNANCQISTREISDDQ